MLLAEDFRAMFATLNQRKLKATKINPFTGYKIYDFEGRILEKIANEELLRHNIFRALHTSLKNPSFDIDMKGIYLGRSADDLYKIDIISKTEHDRIKNQYKLEILCNAREQLKTKSVTSLQNIK